LKDRFTWDDWPYTLQIESFKQFMAWRPWSEWLHDNPMLERCPEQARAAFRRWVDGLKPDDVTAHWDDMALPLRLFLAKWLRVKFEHSKRLPVASMASR